MSTAVVFGSTGAVGGSILTTLLENDAFASVKTISRRLPKAQSPKLQATKEEDSSKWAGMIATIEPKPSVIFNAVGTTRANAGGIANQWKIDHDLCVENARAAKEAGVKTYVYVSSAGTRGFLSKSIPYSKMKNGVEDAIRELGFEQAIIMKPGSILGPREKGKEKAPLLESFFGSLHYVSQGLQDAISQHQEVIARAAVTAVLLADQGKAPSKYWVVEQSDIVRHGRTDWAGPNS